MEAINGNKQDLLNAGRLLNSSEVLFLGGFSSHTTLIKMEKEGEIRVAKRIGNRKRYAPAHRHKDFQSFALPTELRHHWSLSF